jgi:hypothetical protein
MIRLGVHRDSLRARHAEENTGIEGGYTSETNAAGTNADAPTTERNSLYKPPPPSYLGRQRVAAHHRAVLLQGDGDGRAAGDGHAQHVARDAVDLHRGFAERRRRGVESESARRGRTKIN